MKLHNHGHKPAVFWKTVLHAFKLRRHQGEVDPISYFKGHFSLKDIRGAKFPGRQTAATSLCAILQATSLSPSSWSPEVIDRLLLQGDKLHTTRLRDLDRLKTGNGDLKPEELPRHFCSQHKRFQIAFTEVDGKNTDINITGLSVEDFLGRCLKQCLSNKDYALLTVGKCTAAVLTDATYIYLFLSHRKPGKYGREAVLLKFRDCSHLTKYLSHTVFQKQTRFSLVSLDISIEYDSWTDLGKSKLSVMV